MNKCLSMPLFTLFLQQEASKDGYIFFFKVLMLVWGRSPDFLPRTDPSLVAVGFESSARANRGPYAAQLNWGTVRFICQALTVNCAVVTGLLCV